MMLFFKLSLSVAVIMLVNALAKHYPVLGGLIAVLPIISFLSLTTLLLDKQASSEVYTFLTGALSGIMLSGVVLLLMLLLLKTGFSPIQAVLLGISMWVMIAVLGTKYLT